MDLKLNLDYKRKQEDVVKTPNEEITVDYINYAINQAYKDGIEGQLKRMVGRLQRKLDEAIETKQESVKLEEAELDLIKKSFDKTKVPTTLIKYWVILEDEIEKLGK